MRRIATIGFLFSICLAPLSADAELITVISTEGDVFTVDVNPEQFVVDCNAGMRPSAIAKSSFRDYGHQLTHDERSDLRYIITSLATKSWAQLLMAKSSLNRAGDRIDHLHPLRFLEAIFTDDELKSCVHSIRDRKKIWNQFFDGLDQSLQEESDKGNITDGMIQDFAGNIRLDVSLFVKSIQKKKWSELVDALMVHLPRTGNPGRYDQ